jgi:hypothetical protein
VRTLKAPIVLEDPEDESGNTLIFQADDYLHPNGLDEKVAFSVKEEVGVIVPALDGELWTAPGVITAIDIDDLPILLYVRINWAEASPIDESTQ